ncbi:MAG: RagB/SusD family nutrient uptake outer membrane protein [Candidatus Ordinivivax streblomastigis]|uniref:RagB/SusD family nutrient uptake outer membrane protein n=1 Tax=Candidatus Ordinivivax streblomastigis TaxID=2540710 RepID=A0A5M8NU56_9BACT|nr:MAG: RagB/SusD family nutrient uptake outer membrane protein [Candidatus Ordinivivax streblomastigis]
MKIYSFFTGIVILLAFGSLAACNDDNFLKEQTESSYTYSNAFTVSSQVNDCVTELYYKHKKTIYPTSDQQNYLQGMGTDVYDLPFRHANMISNFSNWNSNYKVPVYAFNNFYQLIAQANLVLYGAEQVSWGDEKDKVQAVAQARFFRGYGYMNLAELFGGVPVTESFSETPKFDFQRETRENTYLYAINEMEAAVNVLPDHALPGRIGKGAVYHYLAECYMALATIKNNDAALLDKSVNAANEVMKLHSLMSARFGSRANSTSTDVFNDIPAYYPDGDVFFDLFQRGNLDYEEGNTESLWVDQNDYKSFEQYGDRGNCNNFPRLFTHAIRDVLWRPQYVEPGAKGGPWNLATLDKWGAEDKNSAYIGGRGVALCQPTFYARKDIWENCGDDIRNNSLNIRRSFKVMDESHSLYGLVITEETILQYCTDVTSVQFYPMYTKLAPIDDWGYEGLSSGKNNRTNLFTDFYFCRLAETYLLRAEAKLRKGDATGAAADINEVRRRAKAPLVAPGEVTFDYILDERIRELYGEERRWNTLLRMGGNIPNDRITKHAIGVADVGGANPSTPLWTGNIGQDFLFPIPQSVIDSNLDAQLEQNPSNLW